MTTRRHLSALDELMEERLEQRTLDGWGLASLLLLLPAIGLSLFALGLTMALILGAIQTADMTSHASGVRGFLAAAAPDLVAAWAGAAGAWGSVIAASHRSRW